MTFKFQAFHAVSNPRLSMAFHEGHTKILTDLGIENITSNLPDWMSDPEVIAVIVTDEYGVVVGGIRVHRYNRMNELPIVSAIKEIDPTISEYVINSLNDGGVSESCGLWNSKRVFGQGISPLLARCSVSLSDQFGTKTLICFSAPYTLKMIKSLGFKEVESVGNHGQFPYPNDKFISTVLEIPDIHNIELATESNHQRIMDLMNNPQQKVTEFSQGKYLEIDYNLLVEFA